jgi:hypothetical protein
MEKYQTHTLHHQHLHSPTDHTHKSTTTNSNTTATTTKMQFTTAALSLLAASGLASAAPLTSRQDTSTCPVVQTGDYVWKLSEFYARKPDGKKINSIGFNIKATNEGTLDFNCSASADTIEDNKLYQCGENSGIWFSFQSDRNGLVLRQDVSDR